MPLRAVPVLLSAFLATAALAPAAGLAASGTIAGSVPGTLPPKARGETDLIVFSLADRRIAAARTLSRTGRFSLRLPSGAYALRTSIVDRRASRPSTALLPVSLRSGQRRRALKLKVRRRPARRSGARAAYMQESGKSSQGTAVSVEDFSGATGDWAVLNRGLTDMLITDLVPQTEKCKGAVVANSRDRAAIEGELNLQKSDAFDPATRVNRDFILPDVVVTGTLKNAGGGMDVTLTLTDARSGEVIGTVTDRLSGDWLADEQRIADKLAQKVCRQPEAYQVALKVQATGEFFVYRAQGTAEGLVVARAQDGDADTAPTRWQSEPSEITWNAVSFMPGGGTPCTWTEAGREGQWGVSISANGDGMVTVTTQGMPGAKVTANAICPPSPAVLGGQGGLSLAMLAPETFTVPAGGGTTNVSGSLVPWSSSGTITVRPSAPPG